METTNFSQKSKFLSLIAAMSFAAVSAAHSAVLVTAGSLSALGGTTVDRPVATVVADYGSQQSDGKLHLLLDLGSAQNVDVINFVNRDTATNMAIKSLSIWIAPDEGHPDFDPQSLASFTTNVFVNQNLMPQVNGAFAVRPADVTDFSARYVLIDLTSSFQTNGAAFWYQPGSNFGRAQLGDITITRSIPEPGLVGLAMAGGAIAVVGAIRRNRSRRITLKNA